MYGKNQATVAHICSVGSYHHSTIGSADVEACKSRVKGVKKGYFSDFLTENVNMYPSSRMSLVGLGCGRIHPTGHISEGKTAYILANMNIWGADSDDDIGGGLSGVHNVTFPVTALLVITKCLINSHVAQPKLTSYSLMRGRCETQVTLKLHIGQRVVYYNV